MNEIKQVLLKLANKDYKEFNKKLCPDTDKEMLGIKIPELRKLAKTILKEYDEDFNKENNEKEHNKEYYLVGFIENIDDYYFEEVILQGLVIAYSNLEFREKEKCITKFVPKIDSWAISDTFVPTLKLKKNELEEAWNFITPYTKSKSEFDIRFAVIMMLDYYIIDEYVDKVIKTLDSIKHDGYYVKMGVAWCLAEIGVKYNKKLIAYLENNNNLDTFTYNKTLQKMIESRRITDEQKVILRKMKR